MRINVNFMDHLDVMANNTQNHVANFCNHLLVNLQKLTPYLQYNEFTELGSVMAVNVLLLKLSNKLVELASTRLKLDELPKPWIGDTGKACFKGVVLLTGAQVFNRLMNMQLSTVYLVSSVVMTLAAEALWQRYVQPAFYDYKKSKKAESGADDVVESQDEQDQVQGDEELDDETEAMDLEEDATPPTSPTQEELKKLLVDETDETEVEEEESEDEEEPVEGGTELLVSSLLNHRLEDMEDVLAQKIIN